jgi:hypothetical protein
MSGGLPTLCVRFGLPPLTTGLNVTPVFEVILGLKEFHPFTRGKGGLPARSQEPIPIVLRIAFNLDRPARLTKCLNRLLPDKQQTVQQTMRRKRKSPAEAGLSFRFARA